MKHLAFAAVLALVHSQVAAEDIPVGAGNALIQYTPPPAKDSWISFAAPGAFNGSGQFLLGQQDKGVITFSPPQAFVGFQFFGYQRSDGGIYSITFDGANARRIDVYNKTSTGDDAPLNLFHINDLPNTPHTVVIQNLNDARVGKYGQMNIDHIVITTLDTPAPPPAPTPDPTTPTNPPTVPNPPAASTPNPSPPAQPTPSGADDLPELNDPGSEDGDNGAASLRAAPLAVALAALALCL
ncbi:hypothetical protein AURDEDRAFT_112165 [Auricularia subglabra TFB-10046 SS5]|nr:hypothetical protein AURDEDRAFT_112165 [Auricularia subglabra TFB-10046 SS5]